MVKRRSILQSIGATGAIMIGGSKIATATSSIEGRRVEYLNEEDEDAVISDIKSDFEFSKLRTHFNEDGWESDFGAGIYSVVKPDRSENYYNVTIPFQMENSGTKQVAVNWRRNVGSNTTDVKASVVTSESSTVMKEMTLEVVNGDVSETQFSSESSTETNDTELGTNDFVSGGGGSCTYFHDEYCANFNLSCITWLIGAIGLSCGSSGGIACLAGSGVAVGPYLTDDGCDVCDEYKSEYRVLC